MSVVNIPLGQVHDPLKLHLRDATSQEQTANEKKDVWIVQRGVTEAQFSDDGGARVLINSRNRTVRGWVLWVESLSRCMFRVASVGLWWHFAGAVRQNSVPQQACAVRFPLPSQVRWSS